MKRVFGLFLAVILASFNLATAAQAAPAQTTNGAVRAELLMDLAEVSDKIMSLAKAVPDTKYTWRPADGVRSISEVYMHIAGANYFLMGFAGVKTPDGVDAQGLEKITDKAKVLDALQKSFDFTKKAITDMSDADMDKTAKVFGHDMTYRGVEMLVDNHLHEHLGQSIAYARSNGVVPPWSAKGM